MACNLCAFNSSEKKSQCRLHSEIHCRVQVKDILSSRKKESILLSKPQKKSNFYVANIGILLLQYNSGIQEANFCISAANEAQKAAEENLYREMNCTQKDRLFLSHKRADKNSKCNRCPRTFLSEYTPA